MKTSLASLAFATLLLGGCASDPYPTRRPRPPVDTRTVYADPEPETENKPEDKDEPFIVRSPFGNHRKMDLTGMAPGTKVQDPITGGIFRVPASKEDEPEIVSEPPDDWKPEN